jgi:hypothetical protein
MSIHTVTGGVCGNILRGCNDHCPLQSPVLCDRCLQGRFLSAVFGITIQGSCVGIIRPAMRYLKCKQMKIQGVFPLCLNTGLLRRIESPYIF